MARNTRLACALVLVCWAAGLAAALPPWQPLAVKANVAPYQVKADLGNIANLAQWGTFTPEQRALLAKNAFFVAPADEQQLFITYESNDYLVLPSFVSADTVLQLYHIFYDYSLREVEVERLLPLAERLSRVMYDRSLADWRAAADPGVKTAALKNVAYFAVPLRLLGLGVKPPAAAEAMVTEELATIKAHHGRRGSAIFPYSFDFSQFVPRGHYTRSEDLRRYFMALMWYGLAPLPVQWPERPDPKAATDYEQVRQGLLMTRILYEAKLESRPAIESWLRIYEPTVFYVETADDLTPLQYKELARRVYGHLPSLAELADRRKLDAFEAAALRLPGPKIANAFQVNVPTGTQFRFMGQRVIPDSYMLQELVDSKVPGRRMPTGLDIMAALGSARAYHWLTVLKQPATYPQYDPQLAKLRREFAAMPEADWRENLYWGWLWTLRALLDPPPAGYPAFMRNDAWLDKSLTSTLASWAELRHDTILYAKQSVSAECGDGEEPGPPPPVPKGYVEPQAQAYHRLLWLNTATRQGLAARSLLTPALGDAFDQMGDLLTFLERISVKELTGQRLTAAEYDQIRLIGATLEILTNQVTTAIGGKEGELVSEADEDMAVVADVHTDPATGKVLEEGVGHAADIFVVVPIEGKLYLTRGAVFTHYEFTWPMEDRLTDERWQQMLYDEKAPHPPVWTSTFLTGPKSAIPEPKHPRTSGGGC